MTIYSNLREEKEGKNRKRNEEEEEDILGFGKEELFRFRNLLDTYLGDVMMMKWTEGLVEENKAASHEDRLEQEAS